MKNKNTLYKDSVPEGFTLSMALMDSLPVLFFGASMLTIGTMFHSLLFLTGALLVLAGGLGKVLWKLIIAINHKNVWFLNRQMRYVMPVGGILILLSLFADRDQISLTGMWHAFISMPALIFFLIGIAGIMTMIYFAGHLDSGDAKSNWYEQGINAIAQLSIFLGLLCTVIH